MRARPPAAASAASQTRKVVLLSVLTVVVVAVGIGAVVIGQGAKSRSASGNLQTTPTTALPDASGVDRSPPPTLPPGAFTDFRDDQAGFSIRYPADWHRLNPPNQDLRLIVTPNVQDYAQVRLQYTETPTTPQNLANIEAVMEGSIGSNDTVQMLDQKTISLNGMIGFYYLYTFLDEKSGLRGAHAHYFIFQGRKMNSIVFQALPAERFQDLRGVFDQMLSSFKSDPEPPQATAPPAEPPTTVP